MHVSSFLCKFVLHVFNDKTYMKRILTVILICLYCVLGILAQPVVRSTTRLARQEVKLQTDSLFAAIDYTDSRSLRLAFWSIVAYNRWGATEQNFITTLMKNPAQLNSVNRYKLAAIVAKQHPVGWESYLKGLLYSSDDKLAALAYFNLRESGKAPKAPPLRKAAWKEVLKDLDNRVYQQTLGVEAIKQTIEYLREHAPDSYHIIVLTQVDRSLPAELYLLSPEGKGHKVHGPFSYLLCSMYNALPYFTYGDSPCGVYKIYNRAFSKNAFIGPTETLWTAIPFEFDPKRWGRPETVWTKELYCSFLPESLRDSPLMWQAYRAGAVGRNDIILHGSTIDPENFKDRPFYPLTPSLGCLSALETWDPVTGKRKVSHQKDLMRLIPKSVTTNLGFMYVFQVDKRTLGNKIFSGMKK